MAANATAVREVLAEIASSACDAEETPDALLECFEAAELVVSAALANQRN